MTELRFECTRCGACCRRPGVVVLESAELAAIAEHRGESVESLISGCGIEPREGAWWLRLRTKACPFLRGDECSVHQVRPRQCRTYPFWPEIVETTNSWDAERKHCPGIGIGPVWSQTDVKAMLDSLAEDER